MVSLVKELTQTTPDIDKHADALRRFIEVYEGLSINAIGSLSEVYHPDVVFVDPMHHLTGLSALLGYFDQLFTHVSSCQFCIDQAFSQDEQAALYWTMYFQHSRLNRGEVIKVTGHSHIRFQDGRVIYHRDYVDLGAMLYEHVPLLGRAIRFIKARAGQ